MTSPPPELPRHDPAPARRVEAWPCQSVCLWSPTGETWRPDPEVDALRLFACSGCGSEWVRTEPWTPIDQGGQVPAAVAAERARDLH